MTAAVARSSFRTRDVDEAHEFLRRTYTEHRPTLRQRGGACDVRADAVTAGPLTTSLLRLGMDLETTTDPLDHVVVSDAVRGACRIGGTGVGSGEHVVAPGRPGLYPLGRALPMSVRELVEVRIVQLPLAALEDVARLVTDEPSFALRFDAVGPATAGLGQYWHRVSTSVHAELAHEWSAAAHPLVADQLVRSLATAALVVFPNTTMAVVHERSPGQVAPAALRRAKAFIEEHAAEPLRLGDIAAAAGASPRAVQHAFARHHGTSPLGYLRQVRLERAHRELQAADPSAGVTVAEVAGRWGFGHPGRFATRYREVYGCSPRRTLAT